MKGRRRGTLENAGVVLKVVLEVVLKVEVVLDVVLEVVFEVILDVVLEVILEVVLEIVLYVVLEVVLDVVPEVVLSIVFWVVLEVPLESTKEFRDRDAVLQELEKQGGICDCQGSRDTMIYAASADARGLGPVVKLLGDVVLRPLFKEEEVERTRQTIQFELEDIDMKPDQEQLLFEMIHAAAYTDNTLGLPKLCPRENLGVVNREVLYTFLSHHYVPQRMVVAGVGVEHGPLVEMVHRWVAL
ncbi:putative mitochondrial processing peptidase alpha subunit [Ixodes scapularis]